MRNTFLGRLRERKNQKVIIHQFYRKFKEIPLVLFNQKIQFSAFISFLSILPLSQLLPPPFILSALSYSVSVNLSLCVCLSIHLSIHLSIYLSIYLSLPLTLSHCFRLSFLFSFSLFVLCSFLLYISPSFSFSLSYYQVVA